MNKYLGPGRVIAGGLTQQKRPRLTVPGPGKSQAWAQGRAGVHRDEGRDAREVQHLWPRRPSPPSPRSFGARLDVLDSRTRL